MMKKAVALLLALIMLTLCGAAAANADEETALGIKDAILLCKAIAANKATAEQMFLMDVDADGRLSVTDLAYVCRAILDSSIVFPRDAEEAAYSKDIK